MSSEPKPFIPYGCKTISEADIASVVEVLRSPFVTQGPVVQAFKQAVLVLPVQGLRNSE